MHLQLRSGTRPHPQIAALAVCGRIQKCEQCGRIRRHTRQYIRKHVCKLTNSAADAKADVTLHKLWTVVTFYVSNC